MPICTKNSKWGVIIFFNGCHLEFCIIIIYVRLIIVRLTIKFTVLILLPSYLQNLIYHSVSYKLDIVILTFCIIFKRFLYRLFVKIMF